MQNQDGIKPLAPRAFVPDFVVLVRRKCSPETQANTPIAWLHEDARDLHSLLTPFNWALIALLAPAIDGEGKLERRKRSAMEES